jgi:hypothetical protein
MKSLKSAFALLTLAATGVIGRGYFTRFTFTCVP